MEVIVDVRDGDMSKSKKHCRRAIRQQRRKKQLTWKGWWRRKILNQWYHCKTRCNCLKAHFNSPLSACLSAFTAFAQCCQAPSHCTEGNKYYRQQENKTELSGWKPGSPYQSLQSCDCSCSALQGCNTTCVNTGQSQNICL